MDRDRFLDALCQFTRGLQVLFVVSLVSIIVLLLSLEVVESGTDTYFIIIIQIVSFAGVFAFAASALYLCMRHH